MTQPDLTTHRWCCILDETMCVDGRYFPAVAIEGHRGCYPTDYDYGNNYKMAKRAVVEMNKSHGLSEHEMVAITLSSIKHQVEGGPCPTCGDPNDP